MSSNNDTTHASDAPADTNPPTDRTELREMVRRIEGAAQDADGNLITGDVDHLSERTDRVAEMISEISDKGGDDSATTTTTSAT